MNWSPRTKLIAVFGMLLANALVIAGSWIIHLNGGIDEPIAYLAIFTPLGMMNLVFIWCVFILPKAQLQSN